MRLIWKGLGYYSRASRLLESAKKLRELGDTPFPEDPASLLKLISGVGPYTAGAISSIAFNFPAPLVDGNVIRVLSRWSAMAGDPKHKLSIDYFWNAAKVLLEDERPGDWNQALMDFGATVCTPTAPNCTDCPVKSICKAYIEEHHHKGFKYNLTGDIEDCSLCQSCPVTEAVSMPRHVSFYPVKPPKKGSKCMLSIFVIIESISLEEEFQPEFLIVKRPEKGLLAGLWQFLEVDYSKQPNDKPEDIFALFFKQKFNFDDNFLSGLDLTKIDEFTHLFTHIKQYVSLFHTRFSLSNRMLFDKLVNISPLSGLTKWVSREEFNSISTCKSTQKAMEMLDTTGKPASKKVKRESPSVVSSQKNNLLKYFKNIHPIKF